LLTSNHDETGAAAIGEEQKLVSAQKSVPLSAMEGSPILGVLSKEAPEPAVKNVENASTEDREVLGNWSPVLEIADEINNTSEDKDDVVVEVPEETVKENASTEDREVLGNCSPVLEIAYEIKNTSEDKEDFAVEVPEEAVKEDAFNSIVEAAAPSKIATVAMTEGNCC
jgi:hypothetical protein